VYSIAFSRSSDLSSLIVNLSSRKKAPALADCAAGLSARPEAMTKAL
jgi:hypothetical protein